MAEVTAVNQGTETPSAVEPSGSGSFETPNFSALVGEPGEGEPPEEGGGAAAPTQVPPVEPSEVPAAVVPPSAQPSVPPAQPAAAPQSAPPTPPVAAQPAQPAPPSGQVQPPTAPPAGQFKTQEEFNAWFNNQRNEYVARVASGIKFTPEQERALLTEPHTVLPQLAAQVMFDTLVQAHSNIMAVLPKTVAEIIAAQQQSTKVLDEFYKAFPLLDRNNAQHREVIQRVGSQFRHMYPNAPLDQEIKFVGATAHYMLGIPLTMPQAQPAPAPVTPPAPVAAPPAPPPFVPAAPGAVSAPRPAAGASPYEDVLREDL